MREVINLIKAKDLSKIYKANVTGFTQLLASGGAGSTDEAIISGFPRTGRLVTFAALILGVSFLTLSFNQNLLVKIVGSSLAFGVLLDAVLIRTFIVPALISLMGRWNWWMPKWSKKLLFIK